MKAQGEYTEVVESLFPDRVRDHRPDSADVAAGVAQQLHPLGRRGRLARTEVKEAASAGSHGSLQTGAWAVGTTGKAFVPLMNTKKTVVVALVAYN